MLRLDLDEGAVQMDWFSRLRVERDEQRAGLGIVLNNRPALRFFFYERIEATVINPARSGVFDSCGWHFPGTRVLPWRERVLWEMERAYFGFKLPWLRIQAGRDRFFWGPGYLSSVMLSDHAPSLDHIQFSTRGKNIKFLAFTAMGSRWNERHRFISGQRLEVLLLRRLVLGGAMFNVYTWESARDFSGMLNPLLPLYFSIANSGHGDNLLVGWDATLYLPRSKIYGQLLLDNYEFNTRKDAPNCVGLQAGGLWLPGAWEIRGEYALVTAFTYYHRLRDIMFENYTVPLGHEIGPDADRLWLRISLNPGMCKIGVWSDFTRRGYYNRGDYERLSFDMVDTVFLRHHYEFPARGWNPLAPDDDVEVERTLRIGPEVELTPLPGVYLQATGAIAFYENKDGMPAENRVEPWFRVKLECRY